MQWRKWHRVQVEFRKRGMERNRSPSLSGQTYGRESTLFRINPGCSGKPLWNHVPRRHHGCGTDFSLTKSGTGWTESLLHIFACGTDGNFPVAGVIFDGAGNLYGTTEFGGIQNQDGYGTVSKLSPSGGNWSEAVLHRFSNGRDGAEPAGQLIIDSRGDLLGTTYAGRRYASARSSF